MTEYAPMTHPASAGDVDPVAATVEYRPLVRVVAVHTDLTKRKICFKNASMAVLSL
jgi:hypothetical protein